MVTGVIVVAVVAAVVVACVVLLFVVALLAPRRSLRPQRGVDRSLAAGQRAGGKAPGVLGRWLQQPFEKSREATAKSAAAGRRSRWKLRF